MAQNAPQSVSPQRVAELDISALHIPPRAITYQRIWRVMGLAGVGINLFGMWLLLRLGIAARMRDGVYRRLHLAEPEEGKLPPFRALALYFVLFSFVVLIWQVPFGLARWAVEHAYGFTRQTLATFVGDTALSVLFGLVMLPVVFGGYYLHRRQPRLGWASAWLLLLPLLVFQSVIQPVFIAPAYHKYTPLPDSDLRDQLMQLAQTAGISQARIFVEDTSRRTQHVNAYVTGIGPSARIVFNDTALRTLPMDQLIAMTGHEMGHYVEGHIWIKLVASMFGAGVFLWGAWRLIPWCVQRFGKRWHIRHIYDLAALPILMLILSSFIVLQSPVENAMSRMMERRADAFGLRVTGMKAATIRLFIGFAQRDFADPDPPRLLQLWFGSHPTLKERIEFALAFPMRDE